MPGLNPRRYACPTTTPFRRSTQAPAASKTQPVCASSDMVNKASPPAGSSTGAPSATRDLRYGWTYAPVPSPSAGHCPTRGWCAHRPEEALQWGNRDPLTSPSDPADPRHMPDLRRGRQSPLACRQAQPEGACWICLPSPADPGREHQVPTSGTKEPSAHREPLLPDRRPAGRVGQHRSDGCVVKRSALWPARCGSTPARPACSTARGRHCGHLPGQIVPGDVVVIRYEG